MKKMSKKFVTIMSFILAVVCAFSATACGNGGGEKVDGGKTQLYVATYGGGYGIQWLLELKKRFEAEYKDTRFEEGKMGVQIMYDTDKDKYNGDYDQRVKYDTNEVVFFNDISMEDYINQNAFIDITDAVTAPLTEYGENESIVDKMTSQGKNIYAQNTADGVKYYSIADNNDSLGVVYDIGLWEEKGFYFAKGGCPSEFCAFTQANNADKVDGEFVDYDFTRTGEKSAGPDGKYGTYDDGMPATSDEFKRLLAEMKDAEVDALIWTGQVADTYTSFFTNAFTKTYHGAEEYSLMFNANGGTTEIITGFENGVPKTERIAINSSNYGELAKQTGRYYALELMEYIIDNGYTSSYCWNDKSHSETQEYFLNSNFRATEKPIAMMIEGSWWENEASEGGAFDACVEDYGPEAAKENRKFGFLPMPHATLDKVGGNQVANGGATSIAINANINSEKIELAKTFIRFAHTDESLREYNVVTGIPKNYSYELTDSDKEKMSTFAIEFYNYLQTADIVVEKYDSAINRTISDKLYYSASINKNDMAYKIFVKAFKYDSVSAIDLFEGIYRGAKA